MRASALGDVTLRLELLDLPPLTEAADHVGDRDIGVRVEAVLERAIAIDVRVGHDDQCATGADEVAKRALDRLIFGAQ